MRGRARMIVCLILAAAAAVMGGGKCRGQKALIKTNLLYWATTTPNIGFEVALCKKVSLSGTVGYNAFNFPNYYDAQGEPVNPKLHHLSVMPEVKWWPCRVFERHVFGFHALYVRYNAGGLQWPRILGLHDNRYMGNAYGAGISYGYQWAIGRSWGLELSVGVGYIYTRYAKYECGACGEKKGDYDLHYLGPTKAAISLIYDIR